MKQVKQPACRPCHNGNKSCQRVPKPAVQRQLRNEQPESELAGGVQIDAAAISINAHHSSQQFLFFKDAICSRMCVALGQELSGFQRALFFNDAVYEEMVLTANLGETYAAFCRTRKRLIPGIW